MKIELALTGVSLVYLGFGSCSQGLKSLATAMPLPKELVLMGGII